MSQLNAKFVHKGYWVDNTRGSVMGRTITTDTKTGNVVVALMAVLTTIGTKRLWNLLLFAYHQMRVTNNITDGLYRQQQALMRTLPGPASMLSDWLKLEWIWRKRVDRVHQRSIPLTLLAILFAAITIVVGTFSSYVVESSDVIVLVSSPDCGRIDWEGVEDSRDLWLSWQKDYTAQVAEMADRYTTDCYSNRTATSERCKIFIRPTLPSQQERTNCSFENNMCRNMSLPGISMDTGLMDLNSQLGLNLATRDEMKFRRKTTCSIVEMEGHYDVIVPSNQSGTGTEEQGGRKLFVEEKAMRFFYGATGNINWTFAAFYMPQGSMRTRIQAAPAFYYFSPSNNNSWDPLPGLRNKNDTDLVLGFVLLSGIHYLSPVDDPLFSAHQAFQKGVSDGSKYTMYLPDKPVSVFGCQYQYQFCFAQDKRDDECTSLQGLSTTVPPGFPQTSEIQLALYNLLTQLSYRNDASTAFDYIQPFSTNPLFNPPLPKDQWVKTLIKIEMSVLTQLQIGLSTYAIGTSNLGLETATPMRINQTEGDKGLCSLQRMRSPGGFVNISVFALAFVITFCVVVTLLDLLLLRFLIFWRGFRGLLSPRIDSWIHDGVFQLQRRAYEGHGEGVWERLDKEVPATIDGVQLTTLPIASSRPCHCTVPASPTPPTPPTQVKPPHNVTTTVSEASESMSSGRISVMTTNVPSSPNTTSSSSTPVKSITHHETQTAST